MAKTTVLFDVTAGNSVPVDPSSVTIEPVVRFAYGDGITLAEGVTHQLIDGKAQIGIEALQLYMITVAIRGEEDSAVYYVPESPVAMSFRDLIQVTWRGNPDGVLVPRWVTDVLSAQGPIQISVQEAKDAAAQAAILRNEAEGFAGTNDSQVSAFIDRDGSATGASLRRFLASYGMDAATVEQIVAAYVATDQAVIDAAEQAIESAAVGAGLVSTTDPRLAQANANESVAYAITDRLGRRSWLEIGSLGRPTPHSAALIMEAIRAAVVSLIADEFSTFDQVPETSGVAFTVTDQLGRRAWLEVGPDGGPTRHSLQVLREALKLDALDVAPLSFRPHADAEPRPIASGPSIACYGDSLTAAGQMAARLGQLTGLNVYTRAVGGENAVAITARQGGMPFLLQPIGGEIPASGAVDVVLSSSYGADPTMGWPLLQGSGGGSAGVLAGVPGSLSLRVKDTEVAYPSHGPADVYSFTRTAPGAAVVVNKPSPFIYDTAKVAAYDTQVIWMGQNGPGDDLTAALFEAAVGNLKAPHPRFLLATGTGIVSTAWSALEARMLARWGRRYVNIRRYLIDHAMADLGITPTPEDVTAVNQGRVPPSLRTDGVHHTTAAQQAIAEFLILPRLRELEYIA